MTIHKEGRSLLFWMLVVLAVINFAINYLAPVEKLVINLILIGSIVLYLIVLQFFRNPAIPVPNDHELVYAPADGKVVVIENSVEEEYLK